MVHKSETGRAYCGIPIHAASGVHEQAGELLQSLVPPRVTVLDVGAGSGAMTQRLLHLGYHVVPVDRDTSTWQCHSVAPTCADFNRPDWTRRLNGTSFRGVMALEVIEHLENPRNFLRDLYFVTAPGGYCILSTPNVLCAESLNLLARRGALCGFDEQQYFKSGHMAILPWWLLKFFAEEAGFILDRIMFVGKLDKRGVRLWLTRVLDRAIRLLRRGYPGIPIADDGVVTLVALRRY